MSQKVRQIGPIISLQGVTKSFGPLKALKDINLAVPVGQALAVLGPNGAGKTTLLRMIAGLYAADQGKVFSLHRQAGYPHSEFYERLGYVSENQKLPLEWTVQRLLDYLRPLYPTWDQEFCQRLLTQFELPLDRPMKGFSRGMLMKAALVSSLAYRPALLLLDEPFSGLDPAVREEVIDGLLQLMEGHQWTLLISSHDVPEVERLCDAVCFMEKGQITLQESTESLISRCRQWDVITEAQKPVTPETWPASWIAIEQEPAGRWRWVDMDHQTEGSADRVSQVLGPVVEMTDRPISLRQFYVAVARHRKLWPQAPLQLPPSRS